MELRDNFEVESFYKWMEEVNFPIPVCCDEDDSLCMDCEREKATVEVWYNRKTYTFFERLCDECHSKPDHQEWMSRSDIIKVVKI